LSHFRENLYSKAELNIYIYYLVNKIQTKNTEIWKMLINLSSNKYKNIIANILENRKIFKLLVITSFFILFSLVIILVPRIF